MTLIQFPTRSRGRPSAAATEKYEAERAAFCKAILEIRSRLDFEVSSRGWCYILEDTGGLLKSEFDRAQALINECRKIGLLPLDICVVDDGRTSDNVEEIDPSPQRFASQCIDNLLRSHRWYTPTSFWENQEYYVEVAVEKIDLKSLFSPVCAEFSVPICNMGGWVDINQRAAMMRRFEDWERRGRQCVLLYCGDHDPGGLHISDLLRTNLEDIADAVGWPADNLIIERFGLDAGFIKKHRLTWIENLATSKGEYTLDDPRHADHNKSYVQNYLREFGARKVEANALVVKPKAGRDLCRHAILKYIDQDASEEYWRWLELRREEARGIIARSVVGAP
jgi:hypothetical protein